MDGEPVKSCTVLAASAEGHEIATVEGLERDGVLDTGPAGLPRGARPPVRLLHAGDDADARSAARPQSGSDRPGDPRGDLRPDLPLHGLRDDRPLDPLGGRAPHGLTIRRVGSRRRPSAKSVTWTLRARARRNGAGAAGARWPASRPASWRSAGGRGAAGSARPRPSVLACHSSTIGVPRTSSRTSERRRISSSTEWASVRHDALAGRRRGDRRRLAGVGGDVRRVEPVAGEEQPGPSSSGPGRAGPRASARRPAPRGADRARGGQRVARRGDDDQGGSAGTAPRRWRPAPAPGAGRARCRRGGARAGRRRKNPRRAPPRPPGPRRGR